MAQIITIPYRPRNPQNLIHPQLEAHRFNVLVAHRRLGKTVLAVNHTNKAAIKNTLVEPRYAYIAPYLKQAKLIAWSYLKRFCAPIPGHKVQEAELYIELPHNKAKMWLFGADNADAMRGTYFDGVVMDEYAQFKPEIFPEIIRPALSDRNGWALFMGTPKGQNHFYEIYQTAQKHMNQGDKNWWAGLYRADETGVIAPEELELMRQVQSEAQYRQEFLCDFTAATDDTLITIDIVTASAAKVLTERDVMYAPKVIGVDPARFGDDKSVIIRRQGLAAFEPRTFTKIDNMTLAGHVIEEIRAFKPDAVFIDAGRGEGIIDRCRQLGFTVTEVNFGSTAIENTQYANKRSEMWDGMRAWLEAGGAIPNISNLKTDLVTPTYDFDASNRMRLESKDGIKKRLGRSPDTADALALTFAMPVNTNRRNKGQVEYARHDYDPLK